MHVLFIIFITRDILCLMCIGTLRFITESECRLADIMPFIISLSIDASIQYLQVHRSIK
jgi:hypothetical protein